MKPTWLHAVAYSLFNTPNRIARIRSPDYVRDAEKLFNSEAVPIDHLIAPEQLVIDSIYRLIEYPGALQVVNFAEGKVSPAVVKAYYGGPLIGNALSTMREHMPHIDTRVAAIFRHDRPIRPQGSTIVEAGDEVFFIAASQHIRAVMSELQRLENRINVLCWLAAVILAQVWRDGWKDYSVKLIERDQQRASELAENFRILSCFMAMLRIRNYWPKSISIRLIFYCRHQRRRSEYYVRHAR
ncbi:hypothetical protein EIN43_19965 [Enterobacter hormaechei]|uniref:RCK C-terminal domain-containing protein n=1 Tax=Enterobacter hormaechei TaxID=158836 RepID=A0A4Y5ZW40_9ENTR|nr:hypothetical protein EIN43_19965 [Enterobacter hormaechei]